MRERGLVGAPTEVAGGSWAAADRFVVGFWLVLKREVGSRTPNVGAPTFSIWEWVEVAE
jgi:hypothetical protein